MTTVKLNTSYHLILAGLMNEEFESLEVSGKIGLEYGVLWRTVENEDMMHGYTSPY